jgi:hypothetical protein
MLSIVMICDFITEYDKWVTDDLRMKVNFGFACIILYTLGKVQIFRNDINKSKLQASRNLELTRFRERQLPFGSESLVSLLAI